MRFDHAGHINAWRKHGLYPSIHRNIREAVVSWSQAPRLLDLCCCYGLIGQWLAQFAGVHVVGVDGSERVLAAARDAGISIPLHAIAIKPDTAGEVMALIRDAELTGIIARRALPELFGDDLAFGRDFFAQARQAGIVEVFTEGRISSPAARNALASIDAEIELLAGSFALAKQVGNVAFLKGQKKP